MVVTDPPYLISYKANARKDKTHRFTKVILNDDNKQLIVDYMSECYRILKENSACYMFCSAKTIDFFIQQARNVGFTIKNTIIWDKGNGTMGDLEAQYGQSYEPILYMNKGRRAINGKRIGDVWRFDRVHIDKQVHQNQKPIPLLQRCIINSSNEGDLVFDGFMGSGTTAVACIKEKRNFIGFELSEKYFNIAKKRIRLEQQNLSLF